MKASRSIALEYRLPNPPLCFVGRDAERDRLRLAIGRGPVTVVSGLSGIGKTALVLATLHRHFARRVASIVMITVHRGSLLSDVLRALATCERLNGLDWSALLASEDTLLAAIVDIAEASKRWLVIDGLERLEHEPVRRLVVALARYSRRSKWVLTTSRELDLDEISGQRIRVRGLRSADLTTLAEHVSDDPDFDVHVDVSAAVSSSSGSPRSLIRAMAGRGTGLADEVLSGLVGATREFLRVLALPSRPVPLAVLGALVSVPAPTLLRELEQQGLLLSRPEGVVVQPDARQALLDSLPRSRSAQLLVDLGQTLAETHEPALGAEGVRLLARAGAGEAVAKVLERSGDDLVSAGYAPELLEAVNSAPTRSLYTWRLRLAVETGTVPGGDHDIPDEPSLPARYYAARLLMLGGSVARAAEEAMEIYRDLRDRPERSQLATDTVLVAVRAMAQGGMSAEALDLLDAHRPASARALMYRAVRASVLARVGRLTEARASLAELVVECAPILDTAAGLRVGVAIATTMALASRPREAKQMLDDLARHRSPLAVDLHLGRTTLALRARLALYLGQVGLARELLDRLRPFSAGSTVLALSVRLASVTLKMMTGEFEGLVAEVGAIRAQAHASGLTDHARVASIHLIQLSIIYAEDFSVETPSASPRFEDFFGPYDAERRLLAGHTVRLPTRPSGDEPDVARRSVWTRLRARAALVGGQPALKADALTKSVEELNEAGYVPGSARLLEILCDLHAAAGSVTPLREAATALREIARTLPSRRFQASADLHLAATEPDGPVPSALQRLASLSSVSPAASRRARALLGGSPTLDAGDIRVVSGLAAQSSRLPAIPLFAHGAGGRDLGHSDSRWAEGWGLDEHRTEVWLGDGTTVSFARTPVLWRLHRNTRAHLRGDRARRLRLPGSRHRAARGHTQRRADVGRRWRGALRSGAALSGQRGPQHDLAP